MRNNTTGQFAANDLTGRTFGFLTALEPVGHDNNGYQTWLCMCACGNTKVVSAQPLMVVARGGRGTKSCGCMKKGAPCKSGNALYNSLYCHMKAGAKARKYDFSLTREETFAIYRAPCSYCGAEPHQICRNTSSKDASETYSGIDRVDNRLGYVLGNCVPCCGTCNMAKSTMGLEAFAQWIHRVQAHIPHWPPLLSRPLSGM